MQKDVPAVGGSPAPVVRTPPRRESGAIRRWTKAFFNRPWIARALAWSGLRGSLWKIYCRCLGPHGGVLRLDLDTLHARFYVHSEWIAADLVSFGGEREILQRLVSLLRPGDVVFDVGANLGLYAVFIGEAVGPQGQIVAFEPEAHYCERLTGNAALNGLRNVRVFCLALGDETREVELLPSQAGTAAPRLAGTSSAANRAESGAKVRVVEGDRLMESECLTTPRAVKIDVEGYEYAVLRGLRRTMSDPQCQILCCEIHPALLPEHVTREEILGFLRSCGFTHFDFFPRPPEEHILAVK